jgi:putative PIN family toxin of toxin-antitoxin system
VRVVLDTNILVRANPKSSPEGLARDLLLTVVFGPHVLILSPAILIEVKRVLSYSHIQARWHLSGEAIEKYLAALVAAGVLVEIPTVFPAIVSDPDDDPILQTAIAAGADVLCSRDSAFRHQVVERVCAAHGIRILDDVALLQELRRLRPR